MLLQPMYSLCFFFTVRLTFFCHFFILVSAVGQFPQNSPPLPLHAQSHGYRPHIPGKLRGKIARNKRKEPCNSSPWYAGQPLSVESSGTEGGVNMLTSYIMGWREYVLTSLLTDTPSQDIRRP
jgi:hypothetical protein